jgi:uridine kinase
MRIIPIESINSRASRYPEDFVSFAEAEYRLGIVDAALGIMERRDKPIVLITGPSGSGKTVTAHRLKAELQKLGAVPCIISMDNYFLPLEGSIDNVDLESPDRVDRALFQEQTEKILRGEEVVLPVFNFLKQDREEGSKYTRGKDEIVIFEGIHALNPDVTGKLLESANSVYVSVRTRIKNEKNNSTLHPSKIRLTRRFVRDKLYRGRTLLQTMEKFKSVERGEKLYIMPYKKNARFDIDTLILYEPCVYKKHVLPELKELAVKNPLVSELAVFLEEMEDVGDELVPEFSLVREFIGGNSLME